MDDQFKLSPDKHEEVYRSEIESYAFRGKSPVQKPRLIIVGAQPGAGKTRFLNNAMIEFDGNVVKVNVDDLRRYHPLKNRIRALDDKRYAERTQFDASAWANRVIDQSLANQYNLVIETAMRNPDGICQILQRAKDQGYEIDVRLVAVHERLSMASALERYEEHKSGPRGYGRWVSPELHDVAARGVHVSAEAIEKHGLADSIIVFDRAGEVLFENQMHKGKWRKAPGAAAAIAGERARELTEKEFAAYDRSWEQIFYFQDKRKAPAQEVESARKLQQELETGLTRQPKKIAAIAVIGRDGKTQSYTKDSRSEDLIMLRKRIMLGEQKLREDESKALDAWIEKKKNLTDTSKEKKPHKRPTR